MRRGPCLTDADAIVYPIRLHCECRSVNCEIVLAYRDDDEAAALQRDLALRSVHCRTPLRSHERVVEQRGELVFIEITRPDSVLPIPERKGHVQCGRCGWSYTWKQHKRLCPRFCRGCGLTLRETNA